MRRNNFFVLIIAVTILSVNAQNFDPACSIYTFRPNRDLGNILLSDPNAGQDPPVPAASLCACANICSTNVDNCDFAVYHAAPLNDCVVYRTRSSANVVTIFRGSETVLVDGDVVGYQFNPPATANAGLRLNLVECVNQCKSGPDCDFFNFVIPAGVARTALNTTVGQCWIKKVPEVAGASLIFRSPVWGPGGVAVSNSTSPTATGTGGALGLLSSIGPPSSATLSATITSPRAQPPLASPQNVDEGPSIGVVAGGVIGGCAILGVIIAVFLVIFFRRRAAARNLSNFDSAKQEEAAQFSSNISPSYSQQPLSPNQTAYYDTSSPSTPQFSVPVSTPAVPVVNYNSYQTVNRSPDISSPQNVPLNSGYLSPAIAPMASSNYQNLPRRVSSKKSTDEPTTDYAAQMPARDSIYTDFSNRDSTVTGLSYYTHQQNQQQQQGGYNQQVPPSEPYVTPAAPAIPLNNIHWETYIPKVGPNGEPKYYMSTSKYFPQQEDEIEVDAQDILQMQQVYEDGWCRVLNLMKNTVGVMPCLFLLDDKLRPIEVQFSG